MIVYRQQRCSVETRSLLQSIHRQVESIRRVPHPTRDSLLHALIDAGEWASAIADARAPDRDDDDLVTNSCLDVVTRLAAAADASWCEQPPLIKAETDRAARALLRCARLELPAAVSRGVSEGFAYYGLGPELYADAARCWAQNTRPHTVCCLGLRTIGLTLAATTAAALQEAGINATASSLRPRGHPFDRRPLVSQRFERAIPSESSAWVLVVDEGPGMSGSSMAGAARWLASLGIPRERIVLMPAYQPDLARLAPTARATWECHPIAPASFEGTWEASGRLARLWQASRLVDVSAGRWRSLTSVDGDVPAVHPFHERRKYLVSRGRDRSLVKFAGHGRYGRGVVSRARAAAEAKWAPPVNESGMGWVHHPWRHERFGARDITREDVVQLAQYLAFIARTREVGERPDYDGLIGMTLTNARALCGDASTRHVEALAGTIHDRAAVHVDGRVRPHEWLRVGARLEKTDGVEHGDDHFFPGPTDIAWDVAAMLHEWPLGHDGGHRLVERFVAETHDRTLPQRLRFYEVAYLAFRAAYTAFSRDQLRGTPDGDSFHREHHHYRTALERILPCAC